MNTIGHKASMNRMSVPKGKSIPRGHNAKTMFVGDQERRGERECV